MADLDLVDMSKRVHGGAALRLDEQIKLVDELSDRRQQAEKDLRWWVERVAEVGSLKRRITELRRGLKGLAGPNCLSEIDEYQRGAAGDLQADDARRRRFEAKQRKAARRG